MAIYTVTVKSAPCITERRSRPPQFGCDHPSQTHLCTRAAEGLGAFCHIPVKREFPFKEPSAALLFVLDADKEFQGLLPHAGDHLEPKGTGVILWPVSSRPDLFLLPGFLKRRCRNLQPITPVNGNKDGLIVNT